MNTAYWAGEFAKELLAYVVVCMAIGIISQTFERKKSYISFCFLLYGFHYAHQHLCIGIRCISYIA